MSELEEFEKTEEETLAKFGERALRPDKGSSFSRLLAQHLVSAVNSDPVDSILHVCRAALTLPEHVKEKLNIDAEKTKDILTVALNFKCALQEQDHCSIVWSFTRQGREGFERYIKPWYNTYVSFLVPEKNETIFQSDMPEWERFYNACLSLTPHGFRALLSAWASWAYPFTEELSNKVSSQVSPTTYQEILSEFTKFKEGGK